MMLLGSPTELQAKRMNPKYNYAKMPYVEPQNIGSVFPKGTSKDALSLLLCLLDYDPTQRLPAINALAHPYFDELRDPSTRLPDGSPLPHLLFEFTEEELAVIRKVPKGLDLISKVIPDWKKGA